MNSLIIESRLEQRLRNKIFKFCNICGDEASSKHFSALSCDACAAFFRRTVSGKKIYRCLYKQNCAIYNITPRRMCKFCRYKKCRQSGMNPDEVRSGSNTPANSPPPKAFSTPNPPSVMKSSTPHSFQVPVQDPRSSNIPSTVSSTAFMNASMTTSTPSDPTGFMKAFTNPPPYQYTPTTSVSFQSTVSDPSTIPSMTTSMGTSTPSDQTAFMKAFTSGNPPPYQHPTSTSVSFPNTVPDPSSIPSTLPLMTTSTPSDPSAFMKAFTNPLPYQYPLSTSVPFQSTVPDPSSIPSSVSSMTNYPTTFMKAYMAQNPHRLLQPTAFQNSIPDPPSISSTASSTPAMNAFTATNPHVSIPQPPPYNSIQTTIAGPSTLLSSVTSSVPSTASSIPSEPTPFMKAFYAANPLAIPPPFTSHQIPIPGPSTVPPNVPSSIPIMVPSTIPPAPTPFMKAFQRAVVLENSLFVAVKYPVLLGAYLQPPHDPRLLEMALKNFYKISDKFATVNNFFMFQYIESAGIALETRMVEKFPAIDQLINQSLQQYAEVIKIRVRNEFEFAALCQLSLLKIASEEFPQFQPILAQNYETIVQNFYDYYGNEPGENPRDLLANVSDITSTIHLIRKTYRNQIADILKNF